MNTPMTKKTESLEEMWAGDFGNQYLDRNRHAAAGRSDYWHRFLDTYDISNTLEIGCTQGDNLVHFTDHMSTSDMTGVDVNQVVLDALEAQLPGINSVLAPARELPLPSRAFDFVFTVGLLIHIPDESLREVMAEMVRTSRRYVYCGEYHADEPTTIVYRDQEDVLFKRDYGSLFTEWFPELTMVDEGFLTKEDGFDRITWHLLEVPQRSED